MYRSPQMDNSLSLWSVVRSVLESIGGIALVVGALAYFLGAVWADRIAKQTVARYDQDIEAIKARNTLALEEFKRRSDIELRDREQFVQISSLVYQEFFKNRLATYIKLLEIKNEYISGMHEDAVTEETERWADVYYSSYMKFRKILIEKQIYISSQLEQVFYDLRLAAAKYTNEADIVEGYAIGAGVEQRVADEQRSAMHEKLTQNTHTLMTSVIRQIDIDVSKLRSRIDIDRV